MHINGYLAWANVSVIDYLSKMELIDFSPFWNVISFVDNFERAVMFKKKKERKKRLKYSMEHSWLCASEVK